jgi:Thioredoxin
MRQLVLPVSRRDHIKGPRSAPVTLVEYGDYECPYCGRAYCSSKTSKNHLAIYSVLCFATSHSPLCILTPSMRRKPPKRPARRGSSGRCMIVCLSINRRARPGPGGICRRDRYRCAAVYSRDDRASLRDRVREDFLRSVRSGVTGTPTFFINGARYQGSLNLRSLLAAIEQVADAP